MVHSKKREKKIVILVLLQIIKRAFEETKSSKTHTLDNELAKFKCAKSKKNTAAYLEPNFTWQTISRHHRYEGIDYTGTQSVNQIKLNLQADK